MFPATKIVHLESETSDHKPLLIHLEGIQKRMNKPWRFEQMWMEEEGCGQAVEDTWISEIPGCPMAWVEGKIQRCQKILKWWGHVNFGNVTCALKEKKELLRKAKDAAIQGGSLVQVQRLKKEISDLLVKEEKL